MSAPLIARSPDLTRLVNEGFDIEIRANHLLVHDVPYVNEQKQVALGTLVSDLSLAGDVTTKPQNHVAMFTGGHPCDTNGNRISSIVHASNRQDFGSGVVIDHSFSNKPPEGYADYYEKVTTYVAIISGPAACISPDATARTFKVRPGELAEGPFEYLDTASSRAGIAEVSSKLEQERVVIIGLGGTGAYTLDLVAKTPVRRIDLYDGDRLLQHNAFRGPGAPSAAELQLKPFKVDYWKSVYMKMKRGVIAHPHHVDGSNVDELAGANVVFICMDAGPAKREIIEGLERLGLAFIDVGMGLELVDGAILGQVRVTTSTPDKRDHVWNGRIAMSADDEDDLYSRNIQVADLNALNAALAVGRWKRMSGFYLDLENEHHSVYAVDGNHLLNEETAK